MIALGGPKLKPSSPAITASRSSVSMIALGGPKLKLMQADAERAAVVVSMIALGGPKLKPRRERGKCFPPLCFNDSTGWA